MTKLEQIQHEITSLTPEELSTFREWFDAFDAFDAAAWDARIEADSKAGKLDRLRDQALAAHRGGK